MASSLVLAFTHARFCRELTVTAAALAGLAAAAILLFAATTARGADSPQLAIKVDQVGYPLDGEKIALVSTLAQTFELRRSSDNAVVFHGNLTSAVMDANSGDTVQAADFSKFSQEGSYYLNVPDVGRSWNFTVGKNVYERNLLSGHASVLWATLRDSR